MPVESKLQQFIDSATASKDAFGNATTFNLKRLISLIETAGEYPESLQIKQNQDPKISQSDIKLLTRRLFRNVFFIEIVNDEITSTKYASRWDARLTNDPRGGSFTNCLKIGETLARGLSEELERPQFLEIISMWAKWGTSPNEIPIDYKSKTANPIHVANNFKVIDEAEYLRLLKLRSFLYNGVRNNLASTLQPIFSKIEVKSYLTDRAQTGGFKTNREKRWEAHPNSPQFAPRRDCLLVELQLLDQLTRFKNFPTDLLKKMEKEGLLPEDHTPVVCPVTFDPLDFKVLLNEATNPSHGKAAFQVGHLNPLKAGLEDEFRHAPANISWISQDGNRIQGHLTLKHTQELLLRVGKNYEKSGLFKNEAMRKEEAIVPPQNEPS